MKQLTAVILAPFLVAVLSTAAFPETYGNFTTMGVVVDCPPGHKVSEIGRVRAFLVEGDSRRPLHDLVQVGSGNHFAGSLFFLEPDTAYAVEVEICDRDGNVIGRTTERGRTRPDPVVPETARSLYVTPSGIDGSPGTHEKPLKTIKAALAKVSAGATIFLREGTYYEGDLLIPHGGSAGAPLVIRALPGERAVIDGADPALLEAQWKKGPAGTWSAPFNGSTWNVTFEEKDSGKYYRLYPLRTLEELTGRKSAGKTFEQLGFTGVYHCDGKAIHVVTPAGEPSDYLVHVAAKTRAFDVRNKSHVLFEGLELRHYGRGEYGAAIALTDSSEALVANCKVYYSNTGVWVKGRSFNNTIEDSAFIDDVAHWHFSYAKNPEGWNYHNQVETGAIVTDGKYSGRGLVFRRNNLKGLFDGGHLGPWVDVHPKTSETDFCYNTLETIADDFIETDGYSRNVRIFENRMSESLSGVSLAQALDGPTWVIYNTLIDCGVCAATTLEDYEGYPFKTNGGPRPDVGSGPVFFYHNTAWTSDPKSRALLVKSNVKWRFFVFYNNIWCGKAMGFDKWSGALSPVDWDYDDVYHEAGPFMKTGRTVFNTLADAQSAFRILAHGISADPKFVGAETGDFNLAPGSPCVDSGVVLDGINDGRFEGKAPDMGCFERE